MNYVYFKIEFRLARQMLGTCTEASIWDEHVLQKAKAEIKRANSLAGKISKSLEKYKGVEITKQKEVLELQGVIRAYQALIGKMDTPLPNTVEELLAVAEEVKADFEEKVAAGEAKKATVFMKDEDGFPIISTHMILGNIKENLRIMVSSGDKGVIKSKVAVGEIGALDIKAVEEFMRPNKDIIRDKDGKPVLCERPIRFERMGKTETAISLSEQLPEGTEFGTIVRVRKESPLADITFLEKILAMGLNNGLGCWRGSGNKGSYFARITPVEYTESIPKGWEKIYR